MHFSRFLLRHDRGQLLSTIRFIDDSLGLISSNSPQRTLRTTGTEMLKSVMQTSLSDFGESVICSLDTLHRVFGKWLRSVAYAGQVEQATSQGCLCQVTGQFSGVTSSICSLSSFPL